MQSRQCFGHCGSYDGSEPCKQVLCGLRVHGHAARDRRAGGHSDTAIRERTAGRQSVFILRAANGPNQGAVLFRGRLCAAVQAVEQRSVSVAEDGGRTPETGRTQFPVVDGGPANRAAKSDPKRQGKGFVLKNTGLFLGFLI